MHPLIVFELFGHRIIILTEMVLNSSALAVGFLVFFLLKGRTFKGMDFTEGLSFLALIVCTVLGTKVVQIAVALGSTPWDGWQGFLDVAKTAGATVTGGIFFAVVFLLVLQRTRFRLPPESLNAFVVAMPIAQAVGRIGCFFAGCCYGSVCPDRWYSITYPENWMVPRVLGVEMVHGPRFAVPLFESSFLLALFAAMLVLVLRNRRSRAVPTVYLIGYGSFRFLIEAIRGDEIRGLWGSLGISTAQILSIFFFLVGILSLFPRLGLFGGSDGPIAGDGDDQS